MLIATAVVKPCMGKGAAKVLVGILNLSPDGMIIYKGARLAEATSLEENNAVFISEVSSTSAHCGKDVSADVVANSGIHS